MWKAEIAMRSKNVIQRLVIFNVNLLVLGLGFSNFAGGRGNFEIEGGPHNI
jgi:hypothetical protein